MIKLFWTFLKVSSSTFGGGAIMISLYQNEFVKTGLISSSEFINAVAISQATPGPIATSLATYIGFSMLGIIGIFISNFAIILPTMFIVILFSRVIQKYKDSKLIQDVFLILRPVTIALIASVVIYFIKISAFNNKEILSFEDIYNNFSIAGVSIVLISLLVNIRYKVSPIIIIIFSGIAGVLLL